MERITTNLLLFFLAAAPCCGRRVQPVPAESNPSGAAFNPQQHLDGARRSDIAAHPHSTPLASDTSSRREAMQGIAAATAAATVVAPLAANAAGYPKLKMTTTEGEMEFELWNDVAPKHVESFLKLSKQGFYDAGAFHRIIPGFVIQGGDPNAKKGYGPDGLLSSGDKAAQKKWGLGGPGYSIPAEFNSRPHEFGVLSMARSQNPNSAGSQFFVCLGRLTNLDNQYTVFGKITKGQEVLKKIGEAKTAPGDKPLVRQGIEKMEEI
jgi:cyclophilin family peptidyl-prolyl cis-trans isomerase